MVKTAIILAASLGSRLADTFDKKPKRHPSCQGGIRWNLLQQTLLECQLERLVTEKHHGKMVSTVLEPTYRGYNFNDFHDYLYNHGITVYPGKISKLKSFRLCNIGDLHPQDMAYVHQFMVAYFQGLGE